jgi:hypothetical protein
MSARVTSARRGRLRQLGVAVGLAAGLVAVPGVPVAAARFVPDESWRPVTDRAAVSVTTDDNAGVTLVPPLGWQARDIPNGVMYHSADSVYTVRVYDRDEDKDMVAVAQRVLRAERLGGISAGFVDQPVATADGSLSGRACVLVSDQSVGQCAFLANSAVVVFVESLGSSSARAAPLDPIIGPMTERH